MLRKSDFMWSVEELWVLLHIHFSVYVDVIFNRQIFDRFNAVGSAIKIIDVNHRSVTGVLICGVETPNQFSIIQYCILFRF